MKAFGTIAAPDIGYERLKLPNNKVSRCPPLGKIFSTIREFEDGTSTVVDEAYLAESILEPSKKVVRGYSSQMPSYLGILSETDLESILVYIRKL